MEDPGLHAWDSDPFAGIDGGSVPCAYGMMVSPMNARFLSESSENDRSPWHLVRHERSGAGFGVIWVGLLPSFTWTLGTLSSCGRPRNSYLRIPGLERPSADAGFQIQCVICPGREEGVSGIAAFHGCLRPPACPVFLPGIRCRCAGQEAQRPERSSLPAGGWPAWLNLQV